jgi:hypothetical protein
VYTIHTDTYIHLHTHAHIHIHKYASAHSESIHADNGYGRNANLRGGWALRGKKAQLIGEEEEEDGGDEQEGEDGFEDQQGGDDDENENEDGVMRAYKKGQGFKNHGGRRGGYAAARGRGRDDDDGDEDGTRYVDSKEFSDSDDDGVIQREKHLGKIDDQTHYDDVKAGMEELVLTPTASPR